MELLEGSLHVLFDTAYNSYDMYVSRMDPYLRKGGGAIDAWSTLPVAWSINCP